MHYDSAVVVVLRLLFCFFLLIGTFSYAFRLPRVVAYTVRPSDGFGVRKAKLWTLKHIFLPFQNSDRYSRGVQSPYRSSNREARGHKVTQQKNTATVTRWNVGGGYKSAFHSIAQAT